MTWWQIALAIYFGCNLFGAIWLTQTSRGRTTYINNFTGFMLMSLFGGFAGIVTLIGKGIGWIRKRRRKEK